jgi:hypothetical protein
LDVASTVASGEIRASKAVFVAVSTRIARVSILIRMSTLPAVDDRNRHQRHDGAEGESHGDGVGIMHGVLDCVQGKKL